MAAFALKANDTRPILEVVLKNPDGSTHDLTGAEEYYLHVRLSTHVFTRAMALVGLPAAGTLRYAWQASDWGDGGLPILYAPNYRCYDMEYEVIGGSSRLTFPNTGHDQLCIAGEVG